MSESPRLSPTRRAARLLILLSKPRTVKDLQKLLDIAPSQIRDDIRDLTAEGWPIKFTYAESAGPGPKERIFQLAEPFCKLLSGHVSSMKASEATQ